MRVATLIWMIVVGLWGCSASGYIPVPPADQGSLEQRLAPSRPEQATVRDQHLGSLHTEWRFLEESLYRAEQNRLTACRDPEAAQVNTLAYERCQLMHQVYEQLADQVAQARTQYLRAVSGSGGAGR